LNTYIETKPPRLINNGQEFLWWSERDGWGHYYLYDINGTLKNQVDAGEFVADAIQGIDEKGRAMYFTARGREDGEDPYYAHLYRINLDGTGMKLLDPGDANHTVSLPESARYFVNNSSRINAAPRSAMYDAAGNLLIDLETADIKPLLEHGFKFPEPFKVKADDGITDLYGVMYKPFDFDPNKKYPIICTCIRVRRPRVSPRHSRRAATALSSLSSGSSSSRWGIGEEARSVPSGITTSATV